MTDERIKRINELARKVKAGEQLTEKEKSEQERLRQEYIEDFRKSLRSQLDSIVVQEKDGKRHKLTKKDK